MVNQAGVFLFALLSVVMAVLVTLTVEPLVVFIFLIGLKF